MLYPFTAHVTAALWLFRAVECEAREGRAGSGLFAAVCPAAGMLPGTPRMLDGYLVKEQMVQEQN